MKDEIDNQNFGDQLAIKIARTLFYINLLPSILGIVMIVVMLIFISTAGHFSWMNVFRCLLLIAGIFCEWIYLKKFRFPKNSTKTEGWIYSIILNAMFILYYIVCPLIKDPLTWPLAMAIYPLFILITSGYALKRSINLGMIN